jgi:hypothetical protein
MRKANATEEIDLQHTPEILRQSQMILAFREMVYIRVPKTLRPMRREMFPTAKSDPNTKRIYTNRAISLQQNHVPSSSLDLSMRYSASTRNGLSGLHKDQHIFILLYALLKLTAPAQSSSFHLTKAV